MPAKEHAKYLAILPQMGLTPAMVDADLRKQIYEKLGIDPSGSAQPEMVKKEKLTDAKTLKKIEEKRTKKRQ